MHWWRPPAWPRPGSTPAWRARSRGRWARSCRCCPPLPAWRPRRRRRLRPLGCFYWGKVWTLSAWCELRNDFRGFRIDRIVDLVVLDEQFRQEPGKTLADMLRKGEAEMAACPPEWGAAQTPGLNA